MPAHVKFWGTRGSLPTPASWTRVYGGNTSCVEIRFDDTVFICDAGSGIRELGKDLAERSPAPAELHLFLTHTHWDHIQGFPFFVPAYIPRNRIHVYGVSEGDHSRHRLLSGQMASEYFPVSFRDLGAPIVSDHLVEGERMIHGVRVKSFPLNHPGGCWGYSFEKDGVKIVYATDNELEISPEDLFPDPGDTGNLRRIPASLIEAARDATLLITDAQYSDEQYAAKKGWGHSSFFSVTDFGIQAGVRNLALFHHDPESTDRQIELNVAACLERAARFSASTVIFGAREGLEFKF